MAIRRFLERFSIWHAALLLPWVIASYGFARTFNDNSYLWHVRAGDWQLESGRVLNADPFSFTMQGEPWRTQSWLAELLYSPLDAALGFLAALLAKVLQVAALIDDLAKRDRDGRLAASHGGERRQETTPKRARGNHDSGTAFRWVSGWGVRQSSAAGRLLGRALSAW